MVKGWDVFFCVIHPCVAYGASQRKIYTWQHKKLHVVFVHATCSFWVCCT